MASKREKREQKMFIAEANKLIAEVNAEKEKTEMSEKQVMGNSGLTSGDDIPLVCPGCDEMKYVYVYDDNRTCYCVTCGLEFDLMDGTIVSDSMLIDDRTISGYSVRDIDAGNSAYLSDEYAETKKFLDANDVPKQMPLPGVTPEMVAAKFAPKTTPITTASASTVTGTGSISTNGYSYAGNTCSHYPTHIIAGRNWNVYAGKKSDVTASAHNYDVVFNMSGYSIRQEHSIPIESLKKWETYNSDFSEMLMDWPDYGVVNLPVEFWQELVSYLKAGNRKMLVFCIGGHGRTGTALACLLVAGLNWKAKRAISWIRKNYCQSAIESMSQENYIRAIENQLRKQSRKAKTVTA
jgi:protein-tyrosine phosphatase